MNYAFDNAAQAIDWINGLRYAGEKNGLSNMRALLERMGNPEKRLRMVHVAGTNGKGSTCSMMERMLRECGFKTGLYTSPYLMRFPERMRVNGVPIDDESLTRIASRVREETERLLEMGVKPTTFELGTAITLEYFAEQQVDIAIIEVGLGGRLDPTNVILPEVCLIAPIGMDHTKVLGDTLVQIAGEKAGIIKEGIPVAVAPQQNEETMQVFRNAAECNHSKLIEVICEEITVLESDARGAKFNYRGHEARISLAGRHQVENACLALAGIELLRERSLELPENACMNGLQKAVWPGRLEWLQDNLLIDGAHNPHGAKALSDYVKQYLPGRRIVPVIGMMKDKDVESCVSLYAELAKDAVATQVDYPRAMPSDELRDLLISHGMNAVAEGTIPDALKKAREIAGEDGIVLVCGSLYVVGEVRLMLCGDDGRL